MTKALFLLATSKESLSAPGGCLTFLPHALPCKAVSPPKPKGEHLLQLGICLTLPVSDL